MTESPSANDVFMVLHLLIEADRDITAHGLWLLAHEIVYPTVHGARATAQGRL